MWFVKIFTLFFSLLLSCASKDIKKTTYSQTPKTSTIQANVTVHGNPETAEVNILFVGNSLTYYNDLPKLLYDHAKENNKTISTTMLAKPNYAIIDHWDNGTVQKLIKTKQFDYVIIQQGPSSRPNGLSMLKHDGKKYASLCEKNEAKLVYFMVWPSREYYHTFSGVIKNYTAGAKYNNALLCPVGKIWKAHFDTTNDFSYYGSDQFHPSLKGSKAAAKIIFETLLKD